MGYGERYIGIYENWLLHCNDFAIFNSKSLILSEKLRENGQF